MTPRRRSSQTRRYLALALWAAMLLAPTTWMLAGLLAAGVAVALGPVALRRAKRRLLGARASAARAAGLGSGGASVLGVDPAGRAVSLTDAELAAHALIVGASGAGKSTTLLSILSGRILAGQPVIAIDMKGSPGFAATLERAAAAAGRRLRVWTPDGPEHWNPLAHGNATSLKDMLIATERFTEPHYQRAAERYVQAALQVLLSVHPGRPAQLDEVVAMMEPRRLASMLRHAPAPLATRVQDYLAGLTRDQVSAVRGLGTRLAVLTESTAGPYLQPGAPGATIDLSLGLAGGDVILLSLNSSVYGQLAAQLGALAIQSLVSATGRRLDPGSGSSRAAGEPGAIGSPAARVEPVAIGSPVSRGRERIPPVASSLALVAIDEFSALGADNVLALLARGREAGVGGLIATQEMADLERAGRGFKDQVLGIVGAKLIHRQDVYASALMVSRMAGTELVWDETENLRGLLSGNGGSRGTRRQVEAPRVHPNEIMTLGPGQAVVLTKLPTAAVRRVAIIAPRVPAPAPAPSAAGARPATPPPVATPVAAQSGAAAPAASPGSRARTTSPAGRQPDRRRDGPARD